jgi:hypothetical protein
MLKCDEEMDCVDIKANPPVDRLNRLNAVSLLKTG